MTLLSTDNEGAGHSTRVRVAAPFPSAASASIAAAHLRDAGLDELCDTPEYKRWMRDNAGRIRVTSSDSDDDA